MARDIMGESDKDKTTDQARDADADRQLAESGFKLFKSHGGSSRAHARPENAGLDDRTVDAIERENSSFIGGKLFAITGRARRAADGGNHKR